MGIAKRACTGTSEEGVNSLGEMINLVQGEERKVRFKIYLGGKIDKS